MRKKWIYAVPIMMLAVPLFIFIGGEVVVHLWNWVLPSLFGWREINFWQAIGLFALCRILFGGFGPRGFNRAGYRRRMAERWENATPEERARFREGMRGRCGFGPSAPGNQAQ